MNHLFHIFKLTGPEIEKITAAPDEPHLHEYEELLIGVDGMLEHFIDFKSEEISAPYVSFVTKGKIHRVIPKLKNGAGTIWVIRFKSEFIPDITFQLYVNFHNQANMAMPRDYCFSRLVNLSEMMFAESTQPVPDYAVIKHLLSAMFIMIESERKKYSPADQSSFKSRNVTFKNFLKILEDNFRRPEGVEFYAEKLFMSPRNLNLICQGIMQMSVSEIIETRKLIEAKNLLAGTDKPVSEIGFELGFSEKGYFSNVFKKKSGQTPTAFREEMKKLVS